LEKKKQELALKENDIASKLQEHTALVEKQQQELVETKAELEAEALKVCVCVCVC
jgi:hypothetical protein